MKIIIKTKNLELTDDLQSFIEKKIFSLKKFINILKYPDEGKTLAEIFVEVEKETKHHKKGNIFLVKSRIYLPGREIISQARGEDLFKAIVSAKDELKMEIEKYKFKKIDKNRRQQRKNKI
ncbi:MAG: ribosome-associated translation inhibitor RaiA [Candidatus Staskawiczbacteria bacterium]|nr:ribosome-associated translation inhibitor RaiA [Candidatus Staskawiczbacteria bacterium]